jgi:nicotinate dehydrogenase subunit A
MIMRAVALLRRSPHPDQGTIRREMEAHLCRCGVYGRIVRAVQRAAELREGEGA